MMVIIHDIFNLPYPLISSCALGKPHRTGQLISSSNSLMMMDAENSGSNPLTYAVDPEILLSIIAIPQRCLFSRKFDLKQRDH